MTLSVETIIVVALMMAVFAAVSTIGSSLYLGAGYERLRNGFENIKKQTAFFSDAIHKLDTRVDAVEKQGGYFFQALSELEHKTATPEQPPKTDKVWQEPAAGSLILSSKNDVMHSGTQNLLTASGFISAPVAEAPRTVAAEQAPEERMHFH